MSIVSVAEIGVLARRNNWGDKRISALRSLLSSVVIVDIHSQDIIDAYIDVALFSEGKHPSKVYNDSSRNMGKNDIWIAATTIVAEAQLITADKDFTHLDTHLLHLNLIE